MQDTILKDGGGHKPAYNLRTLSRALEYAVVNGRDYGMHQALYDGFAMSFLTQLDSSSARKMEALLQKHLLRGQTLTVSVLLYTFDDFIVTNIVY